MNSNFQINSKQLFLTYPHCNLPKQQALDALLAILAPCIPIEWAVAHELHKNGLDHLHCYFKLTNAFRSRKHTCLDILGFHGNYGGCRSNKNVIKYCTKEDDYIANFDVAEYLNSRLNKKKKIGSDLINRKRTLIEVVDEDPSLLFGLKKLREDLDEYNRLKGDTRKDLPTFLPNPWGKVISSKISDKRRHYWIFSRQPNKGKTYLFAKPLSRDYRCTIQQGDFSYWSINGDEEGIILDEYNKAYLTYDKLNGMADGNFGYRVFQRGVVKLNEPLIIILSNHSISDLYPFMNNLLLARFREIEIL